VTATLRILRLDRTWYRDDGAHVASATDQTPIHTADSVRDGSSCGWCWLGATHSEAAHSAEVEGRAVDPK